MKNLSKRLSPTQMSQLGEKFMKTITCVCLAILWVVIVIIAIPLLELMSLWKEYSESDSGRSEWKLLLVAIILASIALVCCDASSICHSLFKFIFTPVR